VRRTRRILLYHPLTVRVFSEVATYPVCAELSGTRESCCTCHGTEEHVREHKADTAAPHGPHTTGSTHENARSHMKPNERRQKAPDSMQHLSEKAKITRRGTTNTAARC